MLERLRAIMGKQGLRQTLELINLSKKFAPTEHYKQRISASKSIFSFGGIF